MPVGLEGDWLDRFGALLGDRGRFAERQLSSRRPVGPPSDPERMLEAALDLPQRDLALARRRPACTRCLMLAFRYTAMSDERREGLDLAWLQYRDRRDARRRNGGAAPPLAGR